MLAVQKIFSSPFRDLFVFFIFFSCFFHFEEMLMIIMRLKSWFQVIHFDNLRKEMTGKLFSLRNFSFRRLFCLKNFIEFVR